MATIEKKANTLLPSGLAVTRNGNLKFAVSWKITDKNYSAGHQMRWRVWTTEKKYTAWTNVTVGASTTKKTINVSTSNYYPNAKKPYFYALQFEVRGKRQSTSETSGGDTINTTYEWSGWKSKTWILKAPKAPNVTATLTNSNTTSFAWNGEISTTDERPFSRFEYQNVLLQASKITSGKKVTGWSSSSTSTTNSSWPKSESNISNDSYTRWFRIRAVGPAGASAWVYAKHVYAKPYKPIIKELTAKNASSNMSVFCKWIAKADAAHPNDETIVEYAIEKATTYSGTGTTGATVDDTSGSDSASFMISDTLEADENLFVRVKATHDIEVNTGNWTASNWKIAKYGKLTSPSGLSATLSDSNTASVSVTNNSTVTSARVAIVYRGTNGKDVIVAITSAGSGSKGPLTVKVPTTAARTDVTFLAYAFVGDYSELTTKGVWKSYSIDAVMTSGVVKDSVTSPAVPVAPGNVTVSKSGTEAFLSWSNTWADSTQTELSWSKNVNAWESTEQPQTYVIQNTAAQFWRVANIEPGYIWYFRVRFIKTTEDETMYAPYCETLSLDLTAEPDKPILKLSKANVGPKGGLNATWTYSCADGIPQGSAELARVTNPGSSASYTTFARVATSKSKWISVSGWTTGQNHYVAVRTTSQNGKTSEWSDPVPVYVGAPISLSVTTSLENVTITDGDSQSRTVLSLKALPLTVTATGAGNGGTTTLVIERDDEYHMERPDGSMMDGYAGETIAVYSQIGEAQISIDQNIMSGRFDDGAKYRLTVTAEDGNGQSAETVIPFEVHWDHQAAVPTATVTIENGAAKITATAPSGVATGDGVDIYRLSADLPQLIVQGGAFGTAYVDPYPALGQYGGYRIVDVTKYGDYITSGDQPAWIDTSINLDNTTGYIHFNGETLPILYNVELSSSWSKDFKETKYLGGAVRGDWNPAVSRNSSIKVTILTSDPDYIQSIRRLADWPGICHVRTQDGSSFTADVQVTGDTGVSVAGQLETYSLRITRVEPQELDGLPYSQWNA